MTTGEKVMAIAIMANAIACASEDISYHEAMDLAVERLELAADLVRKGAVTA